MPKYMVLALGVFVFTVGLVVGIFIMDYTSKLSCDQSSLSYYEKTFLRKQGFSQGFGNYELRSFDGGKNWYAVEFPSDGSVIIKGVAEDVFPGLLAHLHGMDVLTEYAEKHGPITLSGPRATTDLKILEAAGFTFEPASVSDGGTDQ